MSILSKAYFHDEAAAFAKLESIVWPTGPVCPHCGNAGKIYDLKGVRSKPSKKHPEGVERHGLKKCAECRKQFTVRVGTVFESSHIPLHKWLQAAYLMASSKKGVSAHQLHRALELTYKSAWFMCHRLREAMRPGNDFGPKGGLGKIIEADETVIGGKERNKRLSKRNPKNIGAVGKQIAFALVERGGHVRTWHVANVTGATLRPIIVSQIDRASTLMTDEAGQYRPVGAEFARHGKVNHGIEEYVRGDCHVNTLEGYFSLVKRGIVGVYHHVSEAHLKRYLAEFDFRYNHRSALGVEDKERTDALLAGVSGKRLTYRRTDSQKGA